MLSRGNRELTTSLSAYRNISAPPLRQLAPPTRINPRMMTEQPKTPQDYRDRAAACEQRARTATHPETREIMRNLALRWRQLAAEAEAKLKLPYTRD